MPVNFDPTEFGKAMGVLIRDATAPLLRRIEELEGRQPVRGADGKDGSDGKSVTVADVAPLIAEQVRAAVDAIPKPQDGKDGEKGKDAEPVNVDAIVDVVVAKLLDSPRLDTLADVKASAAVVEYLKANPPKDGRDGKDGERGPQGERGATGEAGKDGRDGLNVRDMLRNADGHLIAVMSDGTTRDLGEFVGKDGAPGKDGRDGVAMPTIEWDGERTVTVKAHTGEVLQVAKIGIPMDKGYWRHGMSCEKGDIVTHDGIAWIALRETRATPTVANKEDWRIFTRKGKDGDRGPQGPKGEPPTPVKLGGDK